MSQGGPPGDGAILAAIDELRAYYAGFAWESQLWASCGARRSPYRALILFGLSPRTKDHLLVTTCRRFFEQFPCLTSFAAAWPDQVKTARAIVRQGQVPFIESAAAAIKRRGEGVLRDSEGLMGIRGVGAKVVECVMGYGWGKEALPLDGNAVRVVGRLLGLKVENRGQQSAYLRGRLKSIFNFHRGWMTDRAVALIDTHELFRLHGQLICARTPQCWRCPVSRCPTRSERFTGSAVGAVPASLWQDWRELLLDPGLSGAA